MLLVGKGGMTISSESSEKTDIGICQFMVHGASRLKKSAGHLKVPKLQGYAKERVFRESQKGGI